MKRGGDIRHTIMEMAFVISMPTRPEPPVDKGPDRDLDAKQQDKYAFMCNLLKKAVKSYVIRRDLLYENMERVYSIFLGQCTIRIKGQIKSKA